MDYNFLADFLSKFSDFSDLIKATTILTIGFTFISWAYFLKEVAAALLKFLTWKKVLK